MKRQERNIGEILNHSFPRPSAEQVESAGERVLKRLMSETDRPVEAAPPAADPGRWGWRLWPAAAVAVAAVVIALVLHSAWRSGTPAAVDGARTIEYGETVRSNDSAGALLALADGSRIEMRTQSELSLERADDGARIHLSKGSVIVTAAQQGARHLYVQTKDVTVSVVGTVFLVNAEEAGSRVAVIQGEVSVQQGATLKKLLPGDQVATNPIMQSVPLIEEIQWSRNVMAHLALLQQSVIVPPPVAPPQTVAAAPEFEVASIKPCTPGPPPSSLDGRGGNNPGARGGGGGSSPGRLTLNCMTVRNLIQQAYDFYANGRRLPVLPPNFRTLPISGGPAWIDSDRYTINATAEGNPAREMMSGPMLQALLEDRFKLKLHRETREVAVYAMTVARTGLKLQRVEEGSCIPLDLDKVLAVRAPGEERPHFCGDGGIGRRGSSAMVETRANSLERFARMLGSVLDRPVVDRTGVAGMFDFHLEFAPDEATLPRFGPAGGPADPAGSSIFTAIQEQLGLKLESARGPGEFLVIDSVERPSEN